MWLRGFCGCARVSSNYTVWWSVAGRICTRIRTLAAFYDGNQTDGRHFQFALPQTFWQIFLKLSRALLSRFWLSSMFTSSHVRSTVYKTLNLDTWMCVECVSPLSRRFFCFFLRWISCTILRSLGVFVLVHLFISLEPPTGVGDAPAKAINILKRKLERERENEQRIRSEKGVKIVCFI